MCNPVGGHEEQSVKLSSAVNDRGSMPPPEFSTTHRKEVAEVKLSLTNIEHAALRDVFLVILTAALILAGSFIFGPLFTNF